MKKLSKEREHLYQAEIRGDVYMEKVAIMNLVWDEGMQPTYFKVTGLDNIELLRVMQELEEEHNNHEDEVYLDAREVPRLLMLKGYDVKFLSSVSYAYNDEVSYDSGEEDAIVSDMYID